MLLMDVPSFLLGKQMHSICTVLAEKFEDLAVLQVLSFPCDQSTRSP